tara:strand:- start:155 stop:463 length:309 start_codon:yes stop_codon:yes gene_type:complete
MVLQFWFRAYDRLPSILKIILLPVHLLMLILRIILDPIFNSGRNTSPGEEFQLVDDDDFGEPRDNVNWSNVNRPRDEFEIDYSGNWVNKNTMLPPSNSFYQK